VADLILIRLSRDIPRHCRWRIVDASGGSTHGHGTLDEAATFATGRRVVLLAPGPDVLLTRVQLPVRNRTRAAVAVPWALEDRLVADVEDLHFALGEVDGEGRWATAVVARAALESWLAEARAAGLEPQAVVPEALALPPPPPDGWTALEESDRVTVRTGAADGFACERALLGDIAAARPAPQTVVRHVVDGAAAAWPAALQAAAAGDAEAPRYDDALDVFDAATASTALNLLQGPYSRRERLGRALRRWRLPAVLAAAVVLIAAFQAGGRYAQLGTREARLRADIEQVFHESFPEVQRVVNAQAQMRTRLDALREGGDAGPGFAGTLARAGAVISAADDSRIQALTWRGGMLEVELDTGTLQTLDRIKRGLEDDGLHTEVSGAEREGDHVSGQLRIGGTPG